MGVMIEYIHKYIKVCSHVINKSETEKNKFNIVLWNKTNWLSESEYIPVWFQMYSEIIDVGNNVAASSEPVEWTIDKCFCVLTIHFARL